MGGWWILCWYTTVLFQKLLIGKIHSQCSQRSCDNNRQNCYGQHQCSAGKPQGQGHGTDGSLNRGLRQISDDAEQALLQIQSGSEQAEHGAQRTEHKAAAIMASAGSPVQAYSGYLQRLQPEQKE